MAEPRVKAGLWVSMALRMGNANGRYGAVLHKGDPDAGGILVVLSGRAGAMTVLNRIQSADGAEAWMRATGPDPVDAMAVDAYVTRRRKSDPDLWVIEFETPDLLPPFEAKIIP